MHIFFEKDDLIIMMNSQFYPDVKINFCRGERTWYATDYKGQ